MQTQALEQPAAVVLRRSYPVAPEKVWRAWTDPQALKAWFGPGANAVHVAEVDLREGGHWRLAFTGMTGEVNDVSGVYQEVTPYRRLVFSWAWHTTPERVSRVTLEIEARDGGSELLFTHDRFFDEAASTGHNRGWNMGFEKLDAWIAAQAA